jgi:hypothetical protein
VALTLCVWLVCARAEADGTTVHVHMASDGCPSAAQIRERLAPLLIGDAALVISSGERSESEVRPAVVDDLGDRYRIVIAGATRQFDDPRRDCSERARVIAVFIALNAREAPVPPAPPKTKANSLVYGVRALGEVALAGELERFSGGASASFFLAREPFRFGLSIAALSPTTVAEAGADGSGSADLMRVPLALFGSYELQAGSFSFAPELSVGLDLLRIDGSDVQRPQTELRVAPAIALAIAAEWSFRASWALALRVGVTAHARTYDLTVEPTGSLGKTARFWPGAGFGITWRSRRTKAAAD